jgi:hypothetical protein
MAYVPSWQSFVPCFSRSTASHVAATSCARCERCPQHGIARRRGACAGAGQVSQAGEASASCVAARGLWLRSLYRPWQHGDVECGRRGCSSMGLAAAPRSHILL